MLSARPDQELGDHIHNNRHKSVRGCLLRRHVQTKLTPSHNASKSLVNILERNTALTSNCCVICSSLKRKSGAQVWTMFGSSWCHHCHLLFPSVYKTSKKGSTYTVPVIDTTDLMPWLLTHGFLVCGHADSKAGVALQYPNDEFVLAQMDYMHDAVKVSATCHSIPSMFCLLGSCLLHDCQHILSDFVCLTCPRH